MSKYKYVIFTIAVIAVILTFTSIILFNLRKANTKQAEENLKNITNQTIKYSEQVTENEIVETSAPEDIKLSPNAVIKFDKYYKLCNHTISTRENITKDMANLTEQEFANLYSDWDIVKFGSNEVEIYKEFNDECGEHYVVKSNEGVIVIYKIDKNGELIEIERTEISTKYLPDVDIQKLEEGVTLVGKEELNAYIENFE